MARHCATRNLGAAAILGLVACSPSKTLSDQDPAVAHAGCYALRWPTADVTVPSSRPDSVRLDTARAEHGMLRDQLDRRLSSIHDTSALARRDRADSLSWSRHMFLRAWKPVAPDSVILAMGNNWTWWIFRLRVEGDSLYGTAGFQSDYGPDSTDYRITGHRVSCPPLKIRIRAPST